MAMRTASFGTRTVLLSPQTTARSLSLPQHTHRGVGCHGPRVRVYLPPRVPCAAVYATPGKQPKVSDVLPAAAGVPARRSCRVWCGTVRCRRLQQASAGFSTADGAFRRFLVPTFVEGATRGKPLLELPDGVAAWEGRLYVTDRRGDAVHVLSAEDGSVVQTIPFLMGRPHGLAGICCDGHRVVVIDEIRNELHVLTCLQADSERKQNAIAAAGGDKLQQVMTTRSTPRCSTQRSSSTTPRAGATPRTSAPATPHVRTPRAHPKLPTSAPISAPTSAPTSAQPDTSSGPSAAAPASARPFDGSRTPRMSDSSCAAAMATADASPFASAHMMPRHLTATHTTAEFKFGTSDLTLVGHDLPVYENRLLDIHTIERSSPNELVDEDESTGMQARQAGAPSSRAVPSSVPYQAFNQHTLG